jgi:hypothetical protein
LQSAGYNRNVLQQPQPVTPVVELPDPAPTQEVGVADVLIGSFGLVGALTLLALIVGLLGGGGFILFRCWRDARREQTPEDDHTRLRLSGPSAPSARP